ncbi:hypothetical protein FGSG_13001 [Fusarium graminearum PH-1]|uniref:Chromosome 4, complete genome n=1 Tax=Gibberella zeae (strain ATCC MYA-4620 / CBS 123657 / FGSC 9075 / NRRL 31084 / PH-1) TaxID=229533 RepID=I1S825_GIBZE|nr:hypothetical protein FGSG_13001 [Fusarium graminearum PH-1]ESU13008.1 hypothetical protein FGSG_13001 [Fusarium graminearum PH-1]EYB22835.1 hypothetical protein FG05_13001 [Fusarium graminearum]CEF84145.1 unnamed protein product [Fusarium graminearum]|eukprot:XP_011326515.1 hypothetical protein FGSG_13001 [Fusarium graminearum PH-1]
MDGTGQRGTIMHRIESHTAILTLFCFLSSPLSAGLRPMEGNLTTPGACFGRKRGLTLGYARDTSCSKPSGRRGVTAFDVCAAIPSLPPGELPSCEFWALHDPTIMIHDLSADPLLQAPSNRQSPTTTRSYVQILSSVDREITHYPPSFQLLCISSKLSDSVIDSAISRFLAKSTQSCGVYMQQFPTSTA